MYQGKYHEIRKFNGRRIVIDLADVPFPLGSGLEVAVFYASSGKEIEMFHPATVEEAVSVYQRMLDKYPEKPKERNRKEVSADGKNQGDKRTPGGIGSQTGSRRDL